MGVVRRTLAIGAGAALLASCSYVFDLEAVQTGADVEFRPVNRSWNAPDCAKDIDVRAAETGEDVWSIESPRGNCNIPFPATYGVAPPDNREITEAKPLIPGTTYTVEVAAEGSGYASVEFEYR